MEKRADLLQKKWIKKAAVILFWILVWQAAALLTHNALLVAGPADTARALMAGVVTASFWRTVGVSLLRILSGFALAFILGLALAAVSCRIPFAGELAAPLVQFAKAVPVASFVVMLLIWWGSEFLSAAIAFLVVFPIIYVNVLEGLRCTDKKLLEMSKVFGMSFFDRAVYLYRPAVRPFAESALKTAMGMAIKAGVAAEVIGTPAWSIGGELYLDKIYLDTAGVFAWTLVVIVMGTAAERAVLWLFELFCGWKPGALRDKKGPARKRTSEDGAAGEDVLLKCVCKRYGEKQVLDGVDKRLARGRMYCLMAPSGAGKTTLLLVIAGLEQADEGCVTADRAAVAFQDERLLEDEDAFVNAGISRAGSAGEVRSCLSQLFGGEVPAGPVRQLSGGMRRRVCLARALLSDAKLLLLDEPFAGLDEENRRRAAECIRRYQAGRTVVVTTHEETDVPLLGAEPWRL